VAGDRFPTTRVLTATGWVIDRRLSGNPFSTQFLLAIRLEVDGRPSGYSAAPGIAVNHLAPLRDHLLDVILESPVGAAPILLTSAG